MREWMDRFDELLVKDRAWLLNAYALPNTGMALALQQLEASGLSPDQRVTMVLRYRPAPSSQNTHNTHKTFAMLALELSPEISEQLFSFLKKQLELGADPHKLVAHLCENADGMVPIVALITEATRTAWRNLREFLTSKLELTDVLKLQRPELLVTAESDPIKAAATFTAATQDNLSLLCKSPAANRNRLQWRAALSPLHGFLEPRMKTIDLQSVFSLLKEWVIEGMPVDVVLECLSHEKEGRSLRSKAFFAPSATQHAYVGLLTELVNHSDSNVLMTAGSQLTISESARHIHSLFVMLIARVQERNQAAVNYDDHLKLYLKFLNACLTAGATDADIAQWLVAVHKIHVPARDLSSDDVQHRAAIQDAIAHLPIALMRTFATEQFNKACLEEDKKNAAHDEDFSFVTRANGVVGSWIRSELNARLIKARSQENFSARSWWSTQPLAKAYDEFRSSPGSRLTAINLEKSLFWSDVLLATTGSRGEPTLFDAPSMEKLDFFAALNRLLNQGKSSAMILDLLERYRSTEQVTAVPYALLTRLVDRNNASRIAALLPPFWSAVPRADLPLLLALLRALSREGGLAAAQPPAIISNQDNGLTLGQVFATICPEQLDEYLAFLRPLAANDAVRFPDIRLISENELFAFAQPGSELLARGHSRKDVFDALVRYCDRHRHAIHEYRGLLKDLVDPDTAKRILARLPNSWRTNWDQETVETFENLLELFQALAQQGMLTTVELSKFFDDQDKKPRSSTEQIPGSTLKQKLALRWPKLLPKYLGLRNLLTGKPEDGVLVSEKDLGELVRTWSVSAESSKITEGLIALLSSGYLPNSQIPAFATRANKQATVAFILNQAPALKRQYLENCMTEGHPLREFFSSHRYWWAFWVRESASMVTLREAYAQIPQTTVESSPSSGSFAAAARAMGARPSVASAAVSASSASATAGSATSATVSTSSASPATSAAATADELLLTKPPAAPVGDLQPPEKVTVTDHPLREGEDAQSPSLAAACP